MTGPGPKHSSPTVLLVDDEPDVRLVTGLLLRRAGYTVVEADTGRAALDVIREGAVVDVVLLDVMMPEMTGPEALPELRQLDPTLPVVFYSGFDPGEVADELGDASAYTSFLPKPSENPVLVAELDRARTSR